VNAAHPGDQLVIWGTGLGADPTAPVQVRVGGVVAIVGSQGRASCCSGVDQIQFTVPDGVPGCYVPVAVQTSGGISNFATISIAPSGSACSDPLGWSASDLASGAPQTLP
jgi:uncharacterized protein (TIGR03437 family)